jgi:hypothetical protein
MIKRPGTPRSARRLAGLPRGAMVNHGWCRRLHAKADRRAAVIAN